MPEDHLNVSAAALQNVVADLNSCAAQLASAHEQMTSTVTTNTAVWLNSSSSAAAAWKQADTKLAQLIENLHTYTTDFSNTTTQVQEAMTQAEQTNQARF
jgi:uncharacterized protein YukE